MQNMHNASVAIIGASGYSGIEATRILAEHPRVELKLLASERWEGDSIQKRLGIGGPVGALQYAPVKGCEEAARHCDAVLLATPVDVSLQLVRLLSDSQESGDPSTPGSRALALRSGRAPLVIDLSGAFRLANAASYPAFYGFAHPHPELLAAAAYGLPELFRREIEGARLIANPGCYPTAAAIAIAPLLREGFLDDGSIVIDAASGTTGAGRKSSDEWIFSEVDEDFRAYKVLKHQHAPEIAQSLARCAGRPVPMTFTPHLLPIKRGILATVYARLKPGRDPAEAVTALKRFYRSEPFVTVLDSPDEVTLKGVVGTNRCAIGAAWDRTQLDPGRLVVISAIDNLVKGAAGQAVQNLNIAMGWPEAEGLSQLRGFYP